MPPPGSIPRHPGAGSLPRCCASQGRGPGRAPAGLGAPLGALAAPRPRGAACELLEGRWLRAAPLTPHHFIKTPTPRELPREHGPCPVGSPSTGVWGAFWVVSRCQHQGVPPATGAWVARGPCQHSSVSSLRIPLEGWVDAQMGNEMKKQMTVTWQSSSRRQTEKKKARTELQP